MAPRKKPEEVKDTPASDELAEEVWTEVVEPQSEPVKEPDEVKPEPVKEPEPRQCGHVNMHAYGSDGKLQPLTCDLEPKHEGDHHARYVRKAKDEPETDAKGRVVKQTYHEEKADAWWNDAAGKPANQIKEGEIGQMSLLQKDLVMQILSKDPQMPVAKAVEKAKANPAWNIAAEPS